MLYFFANKANTIVKGYTFLLKGTIMTNVNDRLESIQEAIWKYTGYRGNNIDIFLGDEDRNVYLCAYVDSEERLVPDEFIEACYYVAVLPDLRTIKVREYRASGITFTLL